MISKCIKCGIEIECKRKHKKFCVICFKEHKKAYHKKWRNNNKSKTNAYSRDRYKNNPKAKESHRISLNKWRKNNPDKRREQERRRSKRIKENPEKYSKVIKNSKGWHKKYRKDNNAHLNKEGKKYYHKNKKKWIDRAIIINSDPILLEKKRIGDCISGKKYRDNNPEKRKEQNKRYRKNHPGKDWEYMKNRQATDKNFNVLCKLRHRLYLALNKYSKKGKTRNSDCYGVDYNAIIKHLKPFPEDISKYHVDHIKPLSKFKFINSDGSTNLEEIKKAFAPENHQWLLAEDNLKKSDKWEGD